VLSFVVAYVGPLCRGDMPISFATVLILMHLLMGHAHAAMDAPSQPAVEGHGMHVDSSQPMSGGSTRTAESAPPCPSQNAAPAATVRAPEPHPAQLAVYHAFAETDGALRPLARADGPDLRPPRPSGPQRHALLQRFQF
jgi:hypothetical protein